MPKQNSVVCETFFPTLNFEQWKNSEDHPKACVMQKIECEKFSLILKSSFKVMSQPFKFCQVFENRFQMMNLALASHSVNIQNSKTNVIFLLQSLTTHSAKSLCKSMPVAMHQMQCNREWPRNGAQVRDSFTEAALFSATWLVGTSHIGHSQPAKKVAQESNQDQHRHLICTT